MNTTDRLRALPPLGWEGGPFVALERDTLRRLIDVAEGLAREGEHCFGCLAASQGEACACGWVRMLAEWDAFQQEGGQ